MSTEEPQSIRVAYRDQALEFDCDQSTTISDLAVECADRIGAEVERISLFITPKPGMLKFPFPHLPVSEILKPTSRIKLIGTSTKDIKKMNDIGAKSQVAASARRNVKTPQAARSRDWKKVQEESMYSFHAIEPLQYLPNPEKSRRYLERLANDPGIKASMRKHKFSVGLLTEMNPAEHTTHESKTLGLNRNRGEVIELRLRTDRYDGYRDYKIIRKTLCHELSHNVWGDHDRNFWDLTKQIEQEVERNDTLHGGHRLTEQEFYDPNDQGEDVEHADHGGWVGGEFVLGGSSDAQNETGLSRREIMARAALARQEKTRQVDEARRNDEQGQS